MDNEQPIEVVCQSCGFTLRVRRKGAGKTVKCSNCSSPVKVPVPPPPPPLPAPVSRDDAPADFSGEMLGWLDYSQTENQDSPQFPKKPGQGSSPAIEEERPSYAATAQASTATDLTPVVYSSGSSMAAKLPLLRTYPFLVIYAKILRIVGYIILVLASIFVFVSFLITVVAGMQGGEAATVLVVAWSTTSLWLGGSTIFLACALIMNAELIELAMHVQSNTLATAHSVRSLKR